MPIVETSTHGVRELVILPTSSVTKSLRGWFVELGGWRHEQQIRAGLEEENYIAYPAQSVDEAACKALR